MSMVYDGYPFQNGTGEAFEFEGRTAAIVRPRAGGDGRWAIYTEYFGAFPGVAEALLQRGFCVVRLENLNRWGLDADAEARWRFADYLEREKGLSHRCVLIGMSCGGLHAVKFAAMRPDRVAAMYLDAPVLNLLSCPMGYGRGIRDEATVRECLDALSMTETDMLSYRQHPLDHIPALVKARVPLALVYGEEDDVVPFEENGALLADAYRKADIPFLCIGKPGCGHHPHGLDDPMPIADYIAREAGGM